MRKLKNAEVTGQVGRLGGSKYDENNPSKCEAVGFTKARVKDPLNFTLGGSINSGSEQLQILGNNLKQRLRLR